MTLRRRLDRLDRLMRPHVRAPMTDDERRRRYFAMHPDGAAGSLEKLAAQIERLEQAAEAGDEGAAAQLERVLAGWAELVNRHEEHNP